MDTTSFLQQLEEIQKKIAVPLDEKEEQIVQLFKGVRGNEDLCQFLVALLKCPHNRRFFQIIEQYPDLYKNILIEDNVHLFLHEAAAVSDQQIIRHVISMISIALRIHNQTPSPFFATTSTSLIEFGLEWIKIEDLALSEQATVLLLTITKAFDGSQTEMAELMNNLYMRALGHRRNSTILMRYLAIAVKLCKDSETSASAFVSSQLFALLYELCRSDDLLTAINAIEYLSDITKGPGCKVILAVLSHPVSGTSDSSTLLPTPISWLTSLCQEEGNPNFDPFLRDTAMRTLVLIFNNAVRSNYGFIDMDFTLLIQVATQILEDRFGSIESRLAGLGVISDLAQVSSFWFQRVLFPVHDPALRSLSAWLSLLHTGKSELVAAGLFALAHTLLRPDQEYANASVGSHPTSESPCIPSVADMSELKKRLINTIGIARNNTTIKFLIQTARQPVSPLRIAAMDVLHAIVMQSWGLTLLIPETAMGASTSSSSTILLSEFLQYLVDRTTEMDKEGKDAKFEIIKAVKHSPRFQLLSMDTQGVIDRMIAQGAYYMPAMLGEMQTI